METYRIGSIVKAFGKIAIVIDVCRNYTVVEFASGGITDVDTKDVSGATAEEIKECHSVLKKRNRMLNRDGYIVRWMPKIGEEYWKVERVDYGIMVEITPIHGTRYSEVDSLYRDCFSSKESALKSV